MYKEKILSCIPEYLRIKKLPYRKSGRVYTLDCPLCKGSLNATIIPNTGKINCLGCNGKSSLLDIIRLNEVDKKNLSDEEILEYLKEILKVDVITPKEENKFEEILNYYVANKFNLVPIARNEKYPVERDWTNQNHFDKDEWKQWLSSTLNLGLKTGKASGITVLDIDAMPSDIKKKIYKGKATKEEKIEAEKIRDTKLAEILKALGNPETETLVQFTYGGIHLIYQYEDLPKTRIDELFMDVENDGGQIIIPPSKVSGTTRELNLKPITKMKPELLELLKKKITVPRKTESEQISEQIKTGDFKIDPKDFELKNNNLEGCCNSSFISLAGVLRKELNANKTSYVLNVLNNSLLKSPMSRHTIDGMCREVEKYIIFDEQELAHQILKYLKEVETSNKNDLELSVCSEWTKGEGKTRLNKALRYLIREGKIKQKGTNISIIEDMNWTDTLIDVGNPLGFKVPYFHDYAYFCKGEIIIVGSQNKYGKTTIAMNFLKAIVMQGIKPYYIYNEKQGGRFAKTALHLGMKDGDFWQVRCSNPDNLILKENSVAIYDWVCPNKDEGFARTDLLYNGLVEKAEKTNSFLICFVQLKNDDTFFAPSQIGQYPSVLSRYLYESKDGLHTKFTLDKTRESKMRGKEFDIPCQYMWDTKEVKRVDELLSGEQV